VFAVFALRIAFRMANMEVNKAFAAVLSAGIAFMITGLVGQRLVHVERPHESAIQIGDVAAAQPTQAPAAAAPPLEPITPLLASANVQNGQALAQRLCASCHSFNEGGRNGVGPNLYGIIGAPHGKADGFGYSAALKGKAEPWAYENMNAWLLKPNAYAAGTRMAFAGIGNTQQRADVIAYLKSISPKAPEP
jgi:cytochrome c